DGDGSQIATVESTPNPPAPEHEVDAPGRDVATAPEPVGVSSTASRFAVEHAPAATTPGAPEIAGGAVVPPAAAPQPPQQEPAAAKHPAMDESAAPANAATPPPLGARELRIVAAEQTWLSLAVDDEPKRSILLQPGETRSWTARRAFTLTVGNAGGITVSLDGRELPPLGRSGQVVRNLRLPQDATTPG